MKKVMQLMLAVVISALFVTNVSAKGNDTLLNYAKQSHNIAGKNVNLSNSDIVKIERFLNSNELSEDQASQIIAKCDKIVAVLNREGVRDFTKLSKNVKNEIFTLAKEAASVAGVTLTYDNTNKEIVAYKGNEKLDVISLNPYLKQTGSNYALIATIVVALSTTAFMVTKKRNV